MRRQKDLYDEFIQLWETVDQETMPSLDENRSSLKNWHVFSCLNFS